MSKVCAVELPNASEQYVRGMHLRERLQYTPERIVDFAGACEDKFWEGIELASARRFSAAIYLLGYAAEMHLKLAAFRFDDASANDLVYPRLHVVRRWMGTRQPHVPHERFHSVVFWMHYLRGRRSETAKSLNRNLDGLLVHHVQRIYSTWWVEMRYRPDQASENDLNRMFADVNWLRGNQQFLWR
jgi:hypothetical protein